MSRMSFQAMGKPMYAFCITLVRQLVLYIPLLLLMNRMWGFGGLIWAQPVTEVIMMIISVRLLVGTIRKEADAIGSIHEEGKKALVWTANEEDSQKHFLCTHVDGLITDNVSQAVRISEELEKRSDLDRMVDKIKTVL